MTAPIVKTAAGVKRSLRQYYGTQSHLAAMQAFYTHFIKEGALVFDIGAHVGDRTLAFRRLGCRVVAVEPQPALCRTLRLIHGRDKNVSLVQAAVGAEEGKTAFYVNSSNPTVSTASRAFIDSANAGAPGWHGQIWDSAVEVEVVTLDGLIGRFGMPDFVKIDVEGFEDRVLDGLSMPLPQFSFEFTTHQKDVALRCFARIAHLEQTQATSDRSSSRGGISGRGDPEKNHRLNPGLLRFARNDGDAAFAENAPGVYRFNACLGESWLPVFKAPVNAEEMIEWLRNLPPEANSGDIYCHRT